MAQSLAARLKSLRVKRGFTQEELSQVSGVSRASISQYELGLTLTMKSENCMALSNALQISPEELSTGRKSVTHAIQKSQVFFVPVIKVSEVTTSARGFADNAFEDYQHMPTTTKVSENSFAIEIMSDEMSGTSSPFHQGGYVIFDPNREPTHGDCVLVSIDDGTPVFRQLQISGSTHYLKPLNPQYPVIETSGDYHHHGTAVQFTTDINL